VLFVLQLLAREGETGGPVDLRTTMLIWGRSWYIINIDCCFCMLRTLIASILFSKRQKAKNSHCNARLIFSTSFVSVTTW